MNTATSQAVGQWLQFAGTGVFVAGVILSVHHYAIGTCFIAGTAAFFIGKKIRGG